MDKLETRINEKLGVSQDQAHKAVLITADYLRERLPASLYKEVEMIFEYANCDRARYKGIGFVLNAIILKTTKLIGNYCSASRY